MMKTLLIAFIALLTSATIFSQEVLDKNILYVQYEYPTNTSNTFKFKYTDQDFYNEFAQNPQFKEVVEQKYLQVEGIIQFTIDTDEGIIEVLTHPKISDPDVLQLLKRLNENLEHFEYL